MRPRTNSWSLLIVIVLVLVLVVKVVESRSGKNDEMVKKHEYWMAKHGRVYANELEKRRRFGVFKENIEFINEVNSKPNTTFRLSLNAFADLTNTEFNHRLTQNGNPMDGSVRLIDHDRVFSSPHDDNSSAPTSVDWRQKGAVNPVRDQEACPVCWAYASASALESLAFIKTGNLPSASVNQLVDCVYAKTGQSGCYTGAVEDAYTFVIQNGGLATEASYTSGQCTAASLNVAKGFDHVDPPNDEEAVKLAVAHQPVSAYLVTGSKEFQFYSEGVFSGICGDTTNHFGVLVGYGSTPEGVDYWLMRNQWGLNWGEAGYIRLLRNSGIEGGQCQIVSSVTFPY